VIRVLSLMERVRFQRIQELVRVGPGVTVNGASTRVIPGDIWVEGGGGRLGGGASTRLCLGLCWEGCGPCGDTGRWNWSPSGGLHRRGGAADTLCDRSRRAALMGESLLSRAELVGRVATIDWMVPNWVDIVSS